MSDEIKKILSEALQLDDSERASLAASLIDSLDSDAEGVSEDVWEKEVLKRLADLDSGAVQTIPWTEARKQILEGV